MNEFDTCPKCGDTIGYYPHYKSECDKRQKENAICTKDVGGSDEK